MGWSASSSIFPMTPLSSPPCVKLFKPITPTSNATPRIIFGVPTCSKHQSEEAGGAFAGIMRPGIIPAVHAFHETALRTREHARLRFHRYLAATPRGFLNCAPRLLNAVRHAHYLLTTERGYM